MQENDTRVAPLTAGDDGQDPPQSNNEPSPSLPSGRMIAADDLDNLRHMLGVSERQPRGYRNYFVAGGSDVQSMERLRAAGFVVKNERYTLSDNPCYHATSEGARAVGLKALPQ